MSYIDNTRRSLSSGYENTVCLNIEECKILLPFFEKAQKEVLKKYEKYEEIHQSGDASDKEVDLMMKYSDQLEHIDSIIDNIRNLIK